MTDSPRWWFERYDPDVDDAPPGSGTDCDGEMDDEAGDADG